MCLKWKLLCLEQPAGSIWYPWNCSPLYQPEQPAKTYLNSSFPMAHSLPTSHREHPQGHFSSSCMIPMTLSSFCWPPHEHLAQHPDPSGPTPRAGLSTFYLQLGSAATGGMQAHEGSGISAVTCAVAACSRGWQLTGWVCQRPVGQGAGKHPGEDVCTWLTTSTLVKILPSHCP